MTLMSKFVNLTRGSKMTISFNIYEQAAEFFIASLRYNGVFMIQYQAYAFLKTKIKVFCFLSHLKRSECINKRFSVTSIILKPSYFASYERKHKNHAKLFYYKLYLTKVAFLNSSLKCFWTFRGDHLLYLDGVKIRSRNMDIVG